MNPFDDAFAAHTRARTVVEAIRLERAIARDDQLSDEEFMVQMLVINELVHAAHTGPVLCPHSKEP